MNELKSFLASRNVDFGIILNDINWAIYLDDNDSEYSDKIYYENSIDFIQTFSSSVGEADQYIFQSWVPYPRPSDNIDRGINYLPHETPLNLPETDPYSHTRLINEGLKILRGK